MSDHTTAMPVPPASGSSPRRGRRGLIAAGAAGAAVVLVAGGGYAAWQAFSGSGPRPADVLPQDTFAMVSIDLDPSGGQKVEALKTLRKFPTLREDAGLDEDTDPVQAIFEQVQQEGTCKDVDYAEDVEPWIGQRAGLAGVTLDQEPVPVAVLQVTDADAARAGVEKLLRCADAEDQGAYVLTDDYLVLSDTAAHAKAVAASGEKSPLTEDQTFQEWRDEVGGEGIVEMYAAPEAASYLEDTVDTYGRELLGQDPTAAGGEELSKALEDFTGAAAALRFDDGGLELSFASGGNEVDSAQVGEHVEALPADTAAVLAFAVPEQLRTALQDSAGDGAGGGAPQGPFAFVAQALAEVGLSYPDDVLTVLGDSVSISVGGDAPASVDELAPDSVPVGLLVHGDPGDISDVIAKVEQGAGFSLSDLPAYVEDGDDRVALSTQQDYADQLVGDGGLGDDEVFDSVVTEAGDAQSVFFLRLDDEWRSLLKQAAAQDESAKPVVANLDVLRAIGMSAWSDGDTGHLELKVATR